MISLRLRKIIQLTCLNCILLCFNILYKGILIEYDLIYDVYNVCSLCCLSSLLCLSFGSHISSRASNPLPTCIYHIYVQCRSLFNALRHLWYQPWSELPRWRLPTKTNLPQPNPNLHYQAATRRYASLPSSSKSRHQHRIQPASRDETRSMPIDRPSVRQSRCHRRSYTTFLLPARSSSVRSRQHTSEGCYLCFRRRRLRGHISIRWNGSTPGDFCQLRDVLIQWVWVYGTSKKAIWCSNPGLGAFVSAVLSEKW